jgi:hypothetical protein
MRMQLKTKYKFIQSELLNPVRKDSTRDPATVGNVTRVMAMRLANADEFFGLAHSGIVRLWFFVLALITTLTTSCRHSSDHTLSLPVLSPSEGIAVAQPTTEPSSDIDRPLRVKEILTDYKRHTRQDVMILGVVDKLRVKDVDRGLSVLELTIMDSVVAQSLEENKPVADNPGFIRRLNRVSDLMLNAAEAGEILEIDQPKFLSLSYDLKSYGNRIRALSHFFRSKEMTEIGDSINHIGEGYMKFGDAFIAFSEVYNEKNNEFVAESSIISAPIPVGSNSKSRLSTEIVKAGQELLALADLLIDRRHEVLNGTFSFSLGEQTPGRAYSLMSYSELFHAQSWQNRKINDSSSESKFKFMGTGFSFLGTGLTDVYSGFNDLGSKLSLSVKSQHFDPKKSSKLKCTYIGYNDSILRDCVSKVNQLGKDGEIIVRGRLIKGNYREEFNILWVKMESISVDGLTINLAYDDRSPTLKNMSNLYGWLTSDN